MIIYTYEDALSAAAANLSVASASIFYNETKRIIQAVEIMRLIHLVIITAIIV